MKTLFFHNRRGLGPRESSWFTFHNISEELKRRGDLLGAYSSDYGFTDDNNNRITDEKWNTADSIVTVFGRSFGPLSVANTKNIPSFMEINYACPETVNPFMEKELARLGLPESEFSFEMKGMGRETYEKPMWVIGAGNSYTENTYKDFGIERVKMFRAGIDNDNFKPNIGARGKDGLIHFTCTAASLTFRKGLFHILAAWRTLPPEIHKKIRLHLFGSMSSNLIKQEIDELNKKYGNIIHHGFMPNTEPEYIETHAAADCMLCPALAEGQSGTALEGMSFGLYPIVSPYTGLDFEAVPSTILSPEPEKWVAELAEAITRVANDRTLTITAWAKIRNVAVREYKWENFSKSVVDFIESVSKKHGHA